MVARFWKSCLKKYRQKYRHLRKCRIRVDIPHCPVDGYAVALYEDRVEYRASANHGIRDHMRILLIFTALLLSGVCQAQDDPDRRAAVDKLLALSSEAPTAEAEGLAVDNYLNSLPISVRRQLEWDTWVRLRETKRITRGRFIDAALAHNLKYEPDDLAALDYWRYSKLLNAKLERDQITEDEFRYLADKKLDETKAAQKSINMAHQQRLENAGREADAEAQQQRTNQTSNILRGISEGFRRAQPAPTTRTTCTTLYGTVNCTTR